MSHVWTCGKSRGRIYQLVNLVKMLTPAMKEAILNGEMTTGHAEWLLKIGDDRLREDYFQKILRGELNLSDLKYDIYRLKPDAEKTEKELLVDAVEDVYEEDPEVRKLWMKSVFMRRSRKGDKITIEFDGPVDLLDKFATLAAPLKKATKRFRSVVGRNTEIT